MNNNPYSTYSNTQAMTAAPGELTLMLYNGAIRFAKQGIRAIEQKQVQMTHNNLIKVQNILLELMSTLKMEYEISQNLMDLYRFMYDSLMQANMQKDQQKVQDVVELLEEMRDTWSEAIKLARQQQAAVGHIG